jgi:Protein of unknown function (DUF3618)
MGERSNQIEREIQATRNNLGENLGELQDRVKSAIDWRVQVEERPGTMLALAFGGGILLSALFPARRVRHTSDSEPRRTAAPVNDPPPTSRRPVSALDTQTNEVSETLNAIKGALVGVAISKAREFINELVPGFHQELAKSPNQGGEYHPKPPDSAAKFKTAGAD